MKDSWKAFCNSLEKLLCLKAIKDNLGLLLFCAFLSTFLVALTYPGILYSDSYSRTGLAYGIGKSIKACLGLVEPVKLSAWLTPTPSYFIMISLALVGNITLFTFMQAFLFYVVLFLFGEKLAPHGKYLMYTLILFTPVFAGYSVYIEMSIGCVTAIMAMLLLLWEWERVETRSDKCVFLFVMALLSFIIFGFRANSYTILPVLLLVIFYKEYRRIYRLLLVSSVCVGILMVIMIPKVLHINTMASYAYGILWESVSMIQIMPAEKQAKYDKYFDDIFGDGTTKEAIRINRFIDTNTSNICLLGEPRRFKNNKCLSARILSQGNNGKKVIKKYFTLLKEEPQEFFRMKSIFIANTLGIGNPVKFVEYNYNRNNQMNKFRYNDCKQRKLFFDYFVKYMHKMSVFRIPWIMYMAAFLLVILYRVKYKKEISGITIQEASFLIAVFYYGAYLVNTQAFEFRYFFPSWVFLFFIITSLVIELFIKNKKVDES